MPFRQPIALLQSRQGGYWLGEGPFESSSDPGERSAFYMNDFRLSEKEPWKIPSKLLRVDDVAGLVSELEMPVVEWRAIDRAPFKMVFRRVRKAIARGEMLKMVPVVAQRGKLIDGDMRALLGRVAGEGRGADGHGVGECGGLFGYGWVDGARGFVGLTPERLMSVGRGELATMALAGTAKPGDRDGFEDDPKEIREHEYVADFLEEQLAAWGEVQRGGRGIFEGGRLAHLVTGLRVRLEGGHEMSDLVRALHPTPALGCLPRSQEVLEQLWEFRQQLGVPRAFGAPFGLWHEGELELVVAIRGIFWKGRDVVLPAGCGLVAGSAFDHEWRELKEKRDAVREQLAV
jgi:menaquinone-specific isochorismate synthase